MPIPKMGVQIVNNAGELAGKHRLFGLQTKAAFSAIAGQQALYILGVAQELSSGMLWGGQVPTPDQIHTAGYPYSRMKPANSAPTPDYVINIQTGEFLKAWQSKYTEELGSYVVMLWNDSDHAKFMMGTQKMRYRGIIDEVDKRSIANLQKLLTSALILNAEKYNFGTTVSPFGGSSGLLFAIYVGVSSGVNTIRAAV